MRQPAPEGLSSVTAVNWGKNGTLMGLDYSGRATFVVEDHIAASSEAVYISAVLVG